MAFETARVRIAQRVLADAAFFLPVLIRLAAFSVAGAVAVVLAQGALALVAFAPAVAATTHLHLHQLARIGREDVPQAAYHEVDAELHPLPVFDLSLRCPRGRDQNV